MSFNNIEVKTINWQPYPPGPTLIHYNLSSCAIAPLNVNLGNSINQWVFTDNLPQSGTANNCTLILPSASTSAGVTITIGCSDGSLYNYFNTVGGSILIVTDGLSTLYPISESGAITINLSGPNPVLYACIIYCDGINWFQNNSLINW
jgi:hypothetical protein